MHSLLIAAVVFASAMAGIAAGTLARRRLPESHLGGESKDVIKQGIGLIATMVALVLGLLVASAKSAFDAETAGFGQMSTNIILLDRTLARYGPGTGPARESLRRAVASTIGRLWPAPGAGPAAAIDDRALTSEGSEIFGAICGLKPADDAQRAIQAQALAICADFARTRWNLSQPGGPLLPTPFLVVLVGWLGVLFAGLALLTSPNPTVLTTLFICALSLAGAIFLIIDLGDPLAGLIRISDASLRYGLSQLGR